jgi:hypothetical protein
MGLVASAALFLNYSTIINWRYFLTGLPALAPLAGGFYFQIQTKKFRAVRRGFAMTVIGVAFIAAVMGFLIRPKSNEYLNRLALAKNYDERLKLMPRDAVVIAGAQTVAVSYWRGIGLGEWDWIGVGAGWPQGQLEKKISEHISAGRRVFLDVDPRWWLPCSWHVAEIAELSKIEPAFHFRRVAPTIYEIRPLTDQAATDTPHLENLLPEKRTEEVKKCFDSGT